jgi:short-subunit dehydrogenase
LITGASSGIGAELALQFAPIAGKLILIARREAELEKIKTSINNINPAVEVYIFPFDISVAENQREIANSLKMLNLSINIIINKRIAERMKIQEFFHDFKENYYDKIGKFLQLNI